MRSGNCDNPEQIWRIGRVLAKIRKDQGHLYRLGSSSFPHWLASRGYPFDAAWAESIAIPVYQHFKFTELRGRKLHLEDLVERLRLRLSFAHPRGSRRSDFRSHSGPPSPTH